MLLARRGHVTTHTHGEGERERAGESLVLAALKISGERQDVLISSFHLLLHKHCQQVRRKRGGEEDGELNAAAAQVLLLEGGIPPGGDQADRCKRKLEDTF